MATVTHTRPVVSDRHSQFETAVWQNSRKSDGKNYFTVTLKKSWKSDEEWREASIRIFDGQLLGAAKLLDWADTAIQCAHEKKPKAEQGKPIATKRRSYRDGHLEVAIWHNTSDDNDWYTASPTRSYVIKKDGADDEWKDESLSLFATECLAAAHVLTRTVDGIDRHKAAWGSSFVEAAKDTFEAEVVSPDEDIPF